MILTEFIENCRYIWSIFLRHYLLILFLGGIYRQFPNLKTYLSNTVFHASVPNLWMKVARKGAQDWFSRKSNLTSAKFTGHVSSRNVSVDVFVQLYWYSTVQYFVWLLRTETWYEESVIKCLFVWTVTTKAPDFFQNYLLNYFYHVLGQQNPSAEKRWNQTFLDDILEFQTIWTDSAKTCGSLNFSLKTNQLFSKSCLRFSFIKLSVNFFITCKNIG